MIDQGKRAAIARAIYPDLVDLSKDKIVDVFIRGIESTPKGAVTYYYNMKQEAAKHPNLISHCLSRSYSSSLIENFY